MTASNQRTILSFGQGASPPLKTVRFVPRRRVGPVRAIGFGAQTLVKDIISGVFFLADDAFRVGEYIDVGDVMGTVEHISIRSLRLRHHRGPVHTIPFGEIQHLTNFSRDWAIMKIEFRLPFDADLEKVRKIIKKVGQTLMADPVHGPNPRALRKEPSDREIIAETYRDRRGRRC